MSTLRACLLTGGGDAPGLNAAVRAFVHGATRRGIDMVASHYGFEGLLGLADVTPLRLEDVRGILPRGGSILGCSTRSNPFDPTRGTAAFDALASIRGRIEALGVGVLVLLGGDGTMSIGGQLSAQGIPCVGIPKTIDGDVPCTEQTCGLDTAVETATRAIDALHSTAESHQRVMLVEVMGRHAGFVALRSGIAGGADAILVPEIPYDPARVVAKVRARERLGMRFSIVVVGEGARPTGRSEPLIEPAHDGLPARLGGAAELLAHQLVRSDVGHEVRVTVLGHLQRGGPPTASDRLLATRFGVHAAELCALRRFGRMVVSRGPTIDSIPLEEIQVRVARVDPDGELARCARSLGIELGAPAADDAALPVAAGTRAA